MANTPLGITSIIVKADLSSLPSDFASAEAAARTAGARLGTALTEAFAPAVRNATGLVDQFGRAIVTQIAQPAQQAAAPLNALGRLLGDIASQNQKAAVEAAKLAKATAEASQEAKSYVGVIPGFGVAAERFIGLIPGLGQALTKAMPILGFIAFAEAIVRITKNLAEMFEGAGKGGQAARAAFEEAAASARLTNDELQLANDHLRSEIEKIEHKPSNGLREALDEAVVSAEKLHVALLKDIKGFQDLLKANQVSMARQLIGEAGTSDIEARVKGFQDRIAAITANGEGAIRAAASNETVGGVALFSDEVARQNVRAATLRLNTQLTQEYAKELKALNSLLKTAQTPGAEGSSVGLPAADVAARIEVIKGAIASLNEQQRFIDLNAENGDLKGTKDKAQRAADAVRLATEQARKEQEAIKDGYNRQLALMEAAEPLMASEKLAFRENELKELEHYGDRYKDLLTALQVEIGQLSQQSFRELRAAHDREEKEEARYLDEMARFGEHMAKERASIARERNQAAHKEAAITGTLNDDNASALTARQRVSGALANALELEQAGIKTVQIREAQIKEEERLLNLAEATNVPIQDQLRLREKILRESISLGQAENKNVSDQIIALEKLGNARRAAEAANSRKGNVYATLNQAAGGGVSVVDRAAIAGANLVAHSVDGISASLARAIIQGHGLGKAFKDIGKELAGEAFTSVLKIGLQQILKGLMSLIPGFAAVGAAQKGAAVAAHEATSALNVATVISDAAVGFAAAYASTSAIPIVGPILAPAVATETFSAIMAMAPLAAFEAGGRPPVGVASIIGERGPELFVPDQAGTIIPNGRFSDVSAAAGSSSSSVSSSIGSMTFHVHGQQNPDRFVRDVMRKLPGALKTQNPNFAPFSSRSPVR